MKLLAELPDCGDDGRKSRKIATEWAKQNPDLDGYIKIRRKWHDLGGWFFYKVKDGAAKSSAAIDCEPSRFNRK